ncbi:SDR family NAD(P)-dependent oxidoreductase [Streptomyces sp. NPDC056983]|uniref:SDR family NAD(P)-dependent oxidoreductase n=1 Tax=Streptomyces sp. NPDC056983 TaxID=3345987 RepID=UPI0036325839
MTMTSTRWLGLDGKNAVVTGAGGGIGRGVAQELARQGAHVLVIDLDEDGARETTELIARETGAKALHHACDTTDAEQLTEAANSLRREFGAVDILVNNAGIIGSGPLLNVPIEQWQRVLDVNLTGYLLCAREFGADMLERGSGAVVNVSSICGVNPNPGAGAYSPSKAAVSMLSRQLAVEWAARGVRSNAVAPGLIHTPLSKASYADPAVRASRERLVPSGRIGLPEDIANAVVWLASPRADYITGQEIVVDGGLDHSVLGRISSADD